MLKRLAILATSLVFSVSTFAATSNQLNTQTDKFSYVIGLNIGKNFKAQQVQVDPNQLMKGLQDGLTGAKPLLSKAQQTQVMQSYQQAMMKKAQAQNQQALAKNLAAGKAFLAVNAKKPGVKTTSNGLQYKIIKAGKGQSPTGTDSVTVNYEGKTIDGTVFDSSYQRGQPTTFKLNQVIPGWTQALQMMKPGATWMIYIPANLAYGNVAMGAKIPAGSTLIFKVQLISVNK